MTNAVHFFQDLTPELAPLAGGKGAALARLVRAGYPVPEGFVVLASAFEGDALSETAWKQVREALARLCAGSPDAPLAVRSSGASEDSAQASFAGEFETQLGVRGEAALRQAIEAVRRSRHAERVASYSEAHGLEGVHELAVVVQRQVEASHAGVLFTVDPVGGDRWTIVGNAVEGLGERLVGGEATAAGFTLRRPNGRYSGPGALRPYAKRLFRLAEGIEREFGAPQDIEWAIAAGRVAILQSRPITTLRTHDEATGEWNDSVIGDCLWTNGNLGEAVPDVMTPMTWSLVQRFMRLVMPTSFVTAYPPNGNIGGRFYMNLSLIASLPASIGIPPARLKGLLEQAFGKIPDDVALPLLPLSPWALLRTLVPTTLEAVRRMRANHRLAPAFLASAPARCEALIARIRATESREALLALWHDEVEPFFVACCRMMEAGRQEGAAMVFGDRRLRRLVGEQDAGVLVAWGAGSGVQLASLGPLVGLDALARGEIDRETFTRRYGHRGPHEFEVSLPRPGEDPAWLDQQLAGLKTAPHDVAALLERQREAHAAALARLRHSHPRRAPGLERRLAKAASAARYRETSRSEVIRSFWSLRAFVLRAGELLGAGGDAFFLSIDELLDALAGDEAPFAAVPARRATHARYSALPPYPALIRGRFDPVQWAADPQRRSDVFDARSGPPPSRDAITGFPGAAGRVEGRARVVFTPEEGAALRSGEILVTSATNVGWTPLFPRAAAVVTDVGAPLSHAAIVARELGIPAVVGCGNATMRLRTGDRVRVDGAAGTVERLSADA